MTDIPAPDPEREPSGADAEGADADLAAAFDDVVAGLGDDLTSDQASDQTSHQDTDAGAAPEAPTDWEALAADDPRSPGELLAELTEAEARRDEYLEDVRRARAEFENYRKRTMRDGSVQRTAGRGDVVTRLLDVLDDFDRTLQAGQAAPGGGQEGFTKGVELVYGKLLDTLKSLGLTRVGEAGERFDPERHEAVQQVPAEDGPLDEPVVAQVMRPGYELDGRVIRAAMVAVAQ